MGAGASSLIDDLHTSAQMADEVAADRKLAALRSVQELGKDPLTAVQIIEQGGVQPLLQCYNATHPLVRMEAAKALAILAQQPSNQLEMGQDDLLPRYHPALLTASLEFCEHAMALMAELAKPEVNRMKLAHEGLLGPIAAGITAPREALQLHALAALARLCEKPQIAVLATQRGILPSLLRAARSPEAAVKLAVVRVLTGIADCGENMSAFITSGALIFLMGCTYCGRELQLAVAKCLEGLLRQVYEGTAELTEREANMLAVMSAIEVSPERISDDDAMEIQVRTALDMPMVELVPELVTRVKRLINCDRASVFIRSENGNELKTILAEGAEQITIPADEHSIAGECAVQNQVINLKSAYSRANFNKAIDMKTGYRTRSMLVVPIRKGTTNAGHGDGEDEEDEDGDGGGKVATFSNEPSIGVIQCINKLGVQGLSDDNVDEEGHPTFTSEDVRKLEMFTRKITPILEKVTFKKRAPRGKNQLSSDWVQNISTLANLDVLSVVRVTLDRMRDLVLADRASLFIHDRKRKQLWSKIADDLAEIRVPSNAGIVGAVCMGGQALNIEDAYKDDRFNRRIDTATGYRTRTILCVPMKNQRGEVVGVVQCINKKSGTFFTQEDLSNLDEFCWQIASVLEFKASGEGDAQVASGDACGLLLHLVQEKEPEIQLHAASCIGHLARNEANRERIAVLGGVPVLLALAMPWPWRSAELLRGIARSMGNLTISAAVRREISQQGGWKSLLALCQSSDSGVWFDALRALANLALYDSGERNEQQLVAGPALAKQLVDSGALDVALKFMSRTPPDPDLRVQAIRLCGNLSTCCRDGLDAGATAAFSSPYVVKLLGDAAADVADSAGKGIGAEVLTDYASAYARLSRVPAIAHWLFDIIGVSVLESFAKATGPMADDVKAQLGSILANCLRQRQNQRIVLDMLRSHDPTDPDFAAKSTTEQRMLNLKDRDALKTGKDVRNLMTRLLRSPSNNPYIFLQYARILQMLAAEPSNHSYMLQKHAGEMSSYAEQLTLLAGPMQTHGDTQATALRGLRLLADLPPERQVDGILRTLAGTMRIIPILMSAARTDHEDTRVEVCRLVRALARQADVADQMVQSFVPVYSNPMNGSSHALVATGGANGNGANGNGAAAEPPKPQTISFLSILGGLLQVPSSRLQMEACLALEPLADRHKLAMCQAKVVTALIALSHSGDHDLMDCAGRVLKLLA